MAVMAACRENIVGKHGAPRPQRKPQGLFGTGTRWWGEISHTHIYYILYISLRCHHQNDFCIKNESHFNVSLIVRDIVGRYTQTTTFEEKGEPKRY